MKMDRMIFGKLGLRRMRCIVRHWSIAIALFVGTSIFAPGLAHADDWGCQVILCLANPGYRASIKMRTARQSG
jgi:hypothetical protein